MPLVTGNTLMIRLDAGERGVPVTSLIGVLRDATNILRSLEAEMSEDRQARLVWRIASSCPSDPVHVTLQGGPAGGEDVLGGVADAYLEGLTRINDSAQAPPHFTKAALQRVKSLVGVLNDGVHELRFEVPGRPAVTPTRQLADNVDEILLKGLSHTGSVAAPYTVQVRVPSTAADKIVLTKWLMPDGGYIVCDQMICELEMAGESGHMVAFCDGILDQIVPRGSVVEMGQLIALIR